MPVIQCLQHVRFEGPGLFAGVCASRGYEMTRHLVPSDGLPADAGDGLLVMGGPMSVNDPDPWITAETEFIRRHVEAGGAFLGICLGSQLLARALGGRVFPGPHPEIGIHDIMLTADGAADPAFSTFAPGPFPALEWHGEGIEPPDGTAVLARTDAFACQAFRAGEQAYGLLFHLELQRESLANLCTHCPEDLVRGGTTHDICLGSFEIHAPVMAGHAETFMHRILDRWEAA